MVQLRMCPACGWLPDRDGLEARCLNCGTSLEVTLPARLTPTSSRLIRFVLAILQRGRAAA